MPETSNRPLRVFLCHSSTDKPIVRELYQKLLAETWLQPWLDEEELYPGQDWNSEIEKAVEAADTILVCLSNNSITKEGYVQRELRIVLDYADYKPEGTLYIIPVRLENCDPPRRLRGWQYMDFFPESQHERSFSRLLVSLKKRADSLGLKNEMPLPPLEGIFSHTKEDKGELEPIVPEWLRDLNQQVKKSTEDTGELEPIVPEWLRDLKQPAKKLTEEAVHPEVQKIEQYYCSNKFGLIILKSLEEIMGKNGLDAILDLAGLKHYIGNYPTDNFVMEFGFAELSAIDSALEQMYGPRAGRGLALRVGQTAFPHASKIFGAAIDVRDTSFKTLPLQTKLKIGLSAIAKVFSQVLAEQQITVEETDTDWVWTIYKCPYCWGRTNADKPVCYIAIGLLKESLKWISGGNDFLISETKCKTVGDAVCEFVIQKEPIT